jgi:hypothetical protein
LSIGHAKTKKKLGDEYFVDLLNSPERDGDDDIEEGRMDFSMKETTALDVFCDRRPDM